MRIAAILLALSVLLTACGSAQPPVPAPSVASPAPISTTPLPTASPTAPASAIALAEASGLYPADINWNHLVEAFSLDIGVRSWDTPYELSPDAFVMHYLYLESIGEVQLDRSGPTAADGTVLIPRDELERTIPNRFHVPAGYLRTSQYYDAAAQAYRAVDVPPADFTTVTEIVKIEDGAVVHFRNEGGNPWEGAVTVFISPTSQSYRYTYVSFATTRPDQEPPVSAPASLSAAECLLPVADTTIDCAAIARAFAYEIGRDSWENALAIEPDAFVVHYIFLSSLPDSGVTIDYSGPVDDKYGNPLMPQADVESVIARYFDVPAAHIRQSQYYDPATQSYWTGGVGSVVDTAVTRIDRTETGAVIHVRNSITSSDYYDRWDAAITITIAPDGAYRLTSYHSAREPS